MKKNKKTKNPPRGANAEGISVLISPVMLIMAVYFVAMGMAYEFACSLAAVLLHECAHAHIAKKLGYGLSVIKLMPYGAALCGDADIKPRDEALIAIAGPIANAAAAMLFAALWWLVPATYIFTQAFCECNVYIALFNLLPVYPLDGGRVALALLSTRIKRAKAYKIMRVVSGIFGVAAVSAFVLTAVLSAPNVCLLSVGLFMVVSAFIPDRRAQYRELFSLSSRRERISSPLAVKRYAVSGEAELATALRALDPDGFCEFEVLDGELKTMGRLDETTLIAAAKRVGYEAKLSDIL